MNTTTDKPSINWTTTSPLNETFPQGNFSGDPTDEIYPPFKTTIVVLYCVIMFVAVIGNGCVIFLVVSQRQMRNVTNYFIASLATSDVLMALVCIPMNLASNVLYDYWPLPDWMCPFSTYIMVRNLDLSLRILLWICVYQYHVDLLVIKWCDFGTILGEPPLDLMTE